MYLGLEATSVDSSVRVARYEAYPIEAYKVVHTTGNAHLGGLPGGKARLCSWVRRHSYSWGIGPRDIRYTIVLGPLYEWAGHSAFRRAPVSRQQLPGCW
jgi:hypothetical protein